MPTGILLAILAYSSFSIGDAITKGFAGSSLSVFEISFILNLFTLLTLPAARRPDERWRDVLKLRRPVLMHVRSLLYTTASLCFYFAVLHVPFAETYSLAFLAPLFVTGLSLVVLHERVAALRWILTIASFIGVLIVVRPGFRDIGVGHIAAICCALASAGANIILRVLSNSERQVSIIALNSLYQVVAAAILMLGSFVVPTLDEVIRLAIVGILGGASQLLIIRAMQTTPASHFGPTQYVQILWAVGLGALFFHEGQDLVGFVGLAIIIAAGIATIFSDGAQARMSGRWTEFRARRNEPKINRVEGPEI